MLVEESYRIKKTREKLRKYLREMDENTTPQALKQKTLEIHRWIARHAPHRVAVQSKAISLFDENRNPANLSQKIATIANRLKNQCGY